MNERNGIDPSRYRVTADTIDGGDIDLDTEVVYSAVDGHRITEAETEKFTQDRAAGRPSLTGAGKHSPRLSFRVPVTILQLAEQRADAEQVSLSVLARRALEQYLGNDASAAKRGLKPMAHKDRTPFRERRRLGVNARLQRHRQRDTAED
jgi:hypothetical protein